MLAATAHTVRDLDVAEECVQEAFASALVVWARDGVPANPGAWLTTVARRRAIDAVRRHHSFRSKMPLLVEADSNTSEEFEGEPDMSLIEDDVVSDGRLRLIFMCYHPALAPEAQMVLTLRLVCGMTTADIAQLFVVPESTMGARLTRAKKKISTARIPMRVPGASELTDRLAIVLGVIYLLFTMGHTASSGSSLMRTELVDESLQLTRVLRGLMPDEREIRGLLALELVTDARRATRVAHDGRSLSLEEQDRSRWDRSAISEARNLIATELRGVRAALCLASGDCVGTRRGTVVRRDRLERDRSSLRPTAVGVADARCRVESGRGAVDGHRPRRGPRRGRTARSGRPVGELSLPARDKSGSAAPTGSQRGGASRGRARRRTRGQRVGTGVSHFESARRHSRGRLTRIVGDTAAQCSKLIRTVGRGFETKPASSIHDFSQSRAIQFVRRLERTVAKARWSQVNKSVSTSTPSARLRVAWCD